MRNQPCIWVTLVLAVCTDGASVQEEERIAQAFERLGAIVKRDDTRPPPDGRSPCFPPGFTMQPP